MSLFNNVRKRIVRKLMKPEDGYVFVGSNKDKQVQFYYNEEDNVYILGMPTDVGYYNKPTLVGWRDAWMHSTNLKEIPFKKWIYGILENIGDQYSDRLDKITTNEIKQLKRNRNGDKLVINKQSFCDIMHALDKYWDNLRSLECILDVVFEDNPLTAIYDSVIMALEEDMEPNIGDDEEHAIYRWLLEFNAGRNEKAKEGIDGRSLTTAEQLYDYLVWKKEARELE